MWASSPSGCASVMRRTRLFSVGLPHLGDGNRVVERHDVRDRAEQASEFGGLRSIVVQHRQHSLRAADGSVQLIGGRAAIVDHERSFVSLEHADHHAVLIEQATDLP